MLTYMVNFKFESEKLVKAFNRVRREDSASINSDDFYYTNRRLDHYEIQLPHYNGKTFLETLRLRINESNEPVDILDIGCGQGIALAELLKEFPGRIRISGLAATDLREHAPSELQPFLREMDMRVGDAHYLTQIFGPKRFDYIISIKTFQHLEYPESVTQQCGNLLKPGGVAFIQGPYSDIVLPYRQARRVA